MTMKKEKESNQGYDMNVISMSGNRYSSLFSFLSFSLLLTRLDRGDI